MKSKKLFLPTIILAVAIFAMTVCSVAMCVAVKPTVTEAEFPFSITYELDGETVTINEVYRAYFEPLEDASEGKDRGYYGEIGDMGRDNAFFTLKQDENTRLELHTYFYADYMMGDPEYDYFDDEAFEPRIFYYDSEETEYYDEETLIEQGVKLVSFEYPTPIENSFVFSHIAPLSGSVVFPVVAIGVLTLLAVIVLVKKDEPFIVKPIDVISLVLNFLVGLFVLPYFTIMAVFLDISDVSESFWCQVLYMLPALTTLGLAASVALRRKGYKKSSLAVQFIAPVIFVAIMVVFYILNWL